MKIDWDKVWKEYWVWLYEQEKPIKGEDAYLASWDEKALKIQSLVDKQLKSRRKKHE